MHAVLTNQTADILHFSDKAVYECLKKYIFRFSFLTISAMQHFDCQTPVFLTLFGLGWDIFIPSISLFTISQEILMVST